MVLSWITGLLLAASFSGVFGQPKPIGQSCTNDRTHCYTLYDNTMLQDWPSAITACQNERLKLAVIRNSADQTLVERLALDHAGHAWISGRRSTTSLAWTDFGGRVFSRAITEFDSGSRCATIHSNTNVYGAYNCEGPQIDDAFRFICQYFPQNGVCASDGFLLNQRCYKIPVYGDPEIENRTEAVYVWNDANQFCDKHYSGILAYENLDNRNLQEYIRNFVITKYAHSPVWIGVQKQYWVWMIDNSEIPITYTDWMVHEGGQMGDTCAHLDLFVSCLWADKMCSDKSRYFVCESGDGDPIPTVVTTSTTTTTSTTITTELTTMTSATTATPTTTTPTTILPTTPTTTTPTTTTPTPTTPTTTTPTTTPSTTPSTTPTPTATPTTTTTTTPTTTTTVPSTSPTTILQGPVVGPATKAQVESVYPEFGPVGGGTILTIAGRDLGAAVSVLLGPTITCEVDRGRSTDNAIVATTPQVLDRNAQNSFSLSVVFSDGKQVDSNIMFRFRENPVISRLSPNSTIKEGGTTLTVSGMSLDSVAEPGVRVRVNASETCNNNVPKRTTSDYGDECNSTGSTRMMCRIPQMDVLMNASGCLSKEPPVLEIYFKFDGITSDIYYMNFFNNKLYLRPSPEFDESDKIYPFRANQDIIFNGRNIDSISSSDYVVDVLVDGACEVTDTKSDALFCRPPQDEPQKRPGDSNHNIIVHAGAYLQLKVGVLEYPSGLSLQVIIGIACGSVVLVGLIGLTIHCIIKQRKKHSALKEQLVNDPSTGGVDWPYEQRIHLPPMRTDMEGNGTVTSVYSSTIGENLRIGGTWRGNPAARSVISSNSGINVEEAKEEEEKQPNGEVNVYVNGEVNEPSHYNDAEE